MRNTLSETELDAGLQSISYSAWQDHGYGRSLNFSSNSSHCKTLKGFLVINNLASLLNNGLTSLFKIIISL